MLVFYLAAIDSDESKNKFEYIYRKYYRFMLRTASSIIRDSSLAEDAVHETFVQLLKEIDSLRIDNEKSLQSYLYILTRERTIDFLRKWERRRGVLTDYENRSTSFDNFKEPEEIALTKDGIPWGGTPGTDQFGDICFSDGRNLYIQCFLSYNDTLSTDFRWFCVNFNHFDDEDSHFLPDETMNKLFTGADGETLYTDDGYQYKLSTMPWCQDGTCKR